jgi:hypothetical protein
MEISEYIIPIGTKDLELVVEREIIHGTEIIYTESGKSFAQHQVNTLNEIFEFEKLCNPSFI